MKGPSLLVVDPDALWERLPEEGFPIGTLLAGECLVPFLYVLKGGVLHCPFLLAKSFYKVVKSIGRIVAEGNCLRQSASVSRAVGGVGECELFIGRFALCQNENLFREYEALPSFLVAALFSTQ